jgi:integrase/recombinase XerD
VTRLRKMMLEELQRRNYSEYTIRHHLRSVTEFAEHFGKPPDKLGLDELRSYQVYLLKERKLAPGRTMALNIASNRCAAVYQRPWAEAGDVPDFDQR